MAATSSLTRRLTVCLLLPALLVLISACKVDLYSNLDEREANQILAALLENGIQGEKVVGKENTWGLRVEKRDMARAVQFLEGMGLPRERFANIGEIFKKQGLVSSPLQERILYIYALSQEISETLSHIEGVLTARVLVVIPENNPLKDAVKPSSASVFVKHIEQSDLQLCVPKIKQLVVDSIEGLSYENVAVVLFPAARSSESMKPSAAYRRVLGIDLSPASVGNFQLLVAVLLFLLVAALGGVGTGIWRRRKSPQVVKEGPEERS